MDVDEFLAHYGVKGMKWGVRKDRRGGADTSHDDARRVREYKERVKKGSTDALSTKELQELVARMNLEKQYSTLRPPTGTERTKKFVADLLVNAGKQQAQKAVSDQVNKRIRRMLAAAG